jgi:hypothetical protein
LKSAENFCDRSGAMATNQSEQLHPITQLFEVSVPLRVQPNGLFWVLANGQRVCLRCPTNVQPGERIRFYLPHPSNGIMDIDETDDWRDSAVMVDGREGGFDFPHPDDGTVGNDSSSCETDDWRDSAVMVDGREGAFDFPYPDDGTIGNDSSSFQTYWNIVVDTNNLLLEHGMMTTKLIDFARSAGGGNVVQKIVIPYMVWNELDSHSRGRSIMGRSQRQSQGRSRG